MSPLGLSATSSGVRLDLRVMPRAPRTALDGIRGGRLVVRVSAPPVDDAANQAVVQTLAEAFGVARAAIRIASGAHGRNKTVEIAGITLADLTRRIDALGLTRA